MPSFNLLLNSNAAEKHLLTHGFSSLSSRKKKTFSFGPLLEAAAAPLLTHPRVLERLVLERLAPLPRKLGNLETEEIGA